MYGTVGVMSSQKPTEARVSVTVGATTLHIKIETTEMDPLTVPNALAVALDTLIRTTIRRPEAPNARGCNCMGINGDHMPHCDLWEEK